MPIKNIIFDLGGVIVDISRQRMIQTFIELGYKNFHQEFLLFKQSKFFENYETGKINTAEFRKEFKLRFKFKNLDDQTFDKSWNAMIIGFPCQNLQVVKKLSKNYRTFLLSNTNELHLNQVRLLCKQQCGIESFSEYFEREYYSYLLGMCKPDHHVFKIILEQNNLQARETLFIDDNISCIEGANKVGLAALHFENILLDDVFKVLEKYAESK